MKTSSELPAAPLRRVWDLPTRFFHWLLVLLLIGMVVTGNIGGDFLYWHARLGYVLLATLVFRLAWGFVGGHWSRFVHFFPTPARLRSYVKGVPRPGHNPLGAISIFLLFALLLAQLASGLVASDDIAFFGPLNPFVSESGAQAATAWHKHLGKLLILIWVAAHLVAIAWHKRRGEPLLPAMWHGNANVPLTFPESKDTQLSRVLALVLWLLCLGLTFALLLPLSS